MPYDFARYTPLGGEEGLAYVVAQVIAFRIGAEDYPLPISLYGEPGDDPAVFWTVRQPSGACESPDMPFESLDAFKAWCEGETSRRQATGA